MVATSPRVIWFVAKLDQSFAGDVLEEIAVMITKVITPVPDLAFAKGICTRGISITGNLNKVFVGDFGPHVMCYPAHDVQLPVFESTARRAYELLKSHGEAC